MHEYVIVHLQIVSQDKDEFKGIPPDIKQIKVGNTLKHEYVCLC